MGRHSGSRRRRIGPRAEVHCRCSAGFALLAAVFAVGALGGSFGSPSAAAAGRLSGVSVSNSTDASIGFPFGSIGRVSITEVGSFVQQGYRAKLSRALLDRFDIVVAVPRARAVELAAGPCEPSAWIRPGTGDTRGGGRGHVCGSRLYTGAALP